MRNLATRILAVAPRPLIFTLARIECAPRVFVDVGMSSPRSKRRSRTNRTRKTSERAPCRSSACGASSRAADIGVRLELDDVDSDLLLAVRALDYRFTRLGAARLDAFLGAARLDLATPAYGYYFGGGVQLKEIVAELGSGIDLR